MKTGGTLYQAHPHGEMRATHVEHHWTHEHHMAVRLMIAGMVVLLITAIVFFVYRFGGASGSGSSSWMNWQFPYYPFY